MDKAQRKKEETTGEQVVAEETKEMSVSAREILL